MNNIIRYNRYNVRLGNRDYSVLVPDMRDVEAWVTPGWIFHDDYSFIDGNSRYFRVLYETAITLTLYPDYMVYLPLRSVESPPYCPQGREELGRMDALFYNHQIQLDRSKWKVLRNLTKRSKAKLMTVDYDPVYLSGYCKRLADDFHNNKASWSKKSDWHVYYKHYDTLFVEGNKVLYAQDIETIGHFIEENLKDAINYGIRYHIAALGVSNGYFVPSLYGEYVQ